MKYQTTTRAASRIAADCLIVGAFKGQEPGVAAGDIDEASGGWLGKAIASGDLQTSPGKVAVLPSPEGLSATRIAVVGLGKREDYSAARYRKALDKALAALKGRKIRSLAIALSGEAPDIADAYYRGRWALEAVQAASYESDTMKSKKARRVLDVRDVTLLAEDRSATSRLRSGAAHGVGIGEGVNVARELGNLPPNVCTPSYLAKFAKSQAGKLAKLSTKVLNEPELKRLGMGALLSVTAGTDEPARLIVMQYRGASGGKPIALVGKGITFDAGGISLKPPAAMDEMKYDMCGAASVIGAIVVAARLELPINVTAIVPTCENLPSGTATRPGDIVKCMSGQTVEILNTDAEGRLILCDALTYARRLKPDTVIDVATLTGACVIALGHHLSAVMSTSDELRDALVAAGRRAEDRAWPMPAGEDYAESLKSNFADFANVGGREGGASIAAAFLAKFAEGLEWAHMDIAGTAWKGGSSKGATGRPVPLLSQYLLERAGQIPDDS